MFRSAGRKIGGSFVSSGRRLKEYLVNLCYDYKNVVTETALEVRSKPWKGVASGAVLGSIVYAVKTNPDEQHYMATLIHHQLKLGMIGDPIRNVNSNDHVQSMLQLFNERRIGRLNFILFSVIWRRDYDKECDLYAAQCKALKPNWREARSRVIDVGACGRWMFSEREMKQYDINPMEFQ